MSSNWRAAILKEKGLKLRGIYVYAVVESTCRCAACLIDGNNHGIDYDYVAKVNEEWERVSVSRPAMREHSRQVEKVLAVLYGEGRFTVKNDRLYYRGRHIPWPNDETAYCIILPYPFPEKMIWFVH